MKVGVVGLGYVGLAQALLLDKVAYVIGYDIRLDKIKMLKEGIIPFYDSLMPEYIKSFQGHWTHDIHPLLSCDYIMIATPTNYDPEQNYFDTRLVDDTIENILNLGYQHVIVIKSTIPVGHTEHLIKRFYYDKILFIPEFLREGQALYDNIYPSRIIIGDHKDYGVKLATLLQQASLKDDTPILYTKPTEAEAIKLFSNTYLAMRIAFFNELDSYAELKSLHTKDIIEGIGYDPRIGSYYNNPSFGYGGYCLPKDTKQLLANYFDVPQNMMTSIVEANYTRKKHIATMIKSRQPKVVGIYKLSMKSGSDNFRETAVLDIISILSNQGIEIMIYEPLIKDAMYLNYKVEHDFHTFITLSDVIMANRMYDELKPYETKVYTRAIYQRD